MMKKIMTQRTFAWISLLMMSLSINAAQAGTLPQQIADSVNQWLTLNANETWQQRYNLALLAAAKHL